MYTDTSGAEGLSHAFMPLMPSNSTEAIDQAFVDMTIARASGKAVPKSDKPMHQVDASKDLSSSVAKGPPKRDSGGVYVCGKH